MAAFAGANAVGALLQNADALIKNADAAGMTFEAYQRLKFGLEQAGVSAAGFQKGAVKLNKVLYDAARGSKTAKDALGAIGLTYEQLANQSPEERFKSVLKALEGVDDAGRRAALSQELLGKEFANRSINTDGLDAAAAGMVTISEEAARASERINDTMNEMGTSAKNSLTNLVAPALDRVLDIWRNWDGIMRSVDDFLKTELGIGVEQVFDSIKTIAEGVSIFVKEWWDVAKKFLKVLWDVVTLDFKEAFEGIGTVLRTVVDKFKEHFGSAIRNLTENIKRQFQWAVKLVAVSFTNFFKNAINAALKPIETFVNSLIDRVNSIKEFFGGSGTLGHIAIEGYTPQEVPQNPGWYNPTTIDVGAGLTTEELIAGAAAAIDRAGVTPPGSITDDDSGSGGGGSSKGSGKADEPAEETSSAFMDSMKSSLSQALISGDWKEFMHSALDNFTMSIIDKFSGSLMDALLGDFDFDAIFENFGENMSDSLKGIFDGLKGMLSGLGGGGGGFDFGNLLQMGMSFFGFSDGGLVPKTPYSKIGRDSVPAMLTPGEVVVPVDEVGKSSGGQVVINQNFTGDISKHTRAEMMRSIPELATAVNQYNREMGIR